MTLVRWREIVLHNAPTFALDVDPVSARVLWDLRPAVTTPYFEECFLKMCQRPIPYGSGYERWREIMAAEQEQGKSIWYLGRDRADQPDEPDATAV